MAGGRACYKDQFELTCWYPEVTAPGRYLVPSPGWKVNGSVLTTDGIAYREERINDTATKLTVTVTNTFSVNTVVAYSCFLVLADSRLDESSQQVYIRIMGQWYVSAYLSVVQDGGKVLTLFNCVSLHTLHSIASLFSSFHICAHAATPNPPVITNVTSLNSTSISLHWTHDKTCFESVPLEYHVVVNTDTQRIITGEMGTVISVVSDTPYTVSVMAVVDSSQRSEPDRESITAGGCRG